MTDSAEGEYNGKIQRSDIALYRTNGYLIIRNFFSDLTPLERVMAEITQLGRVFNPEFKMNVASHLLTMPKTERGNFYRGLRYLPSLTMLASSNLLTGTSRQLGLSIPAVMHSYNIRMDVPNEGQHLFHWHQDIAYLLGSLNSITYWLPLGKADAHHGGVSLISGSHLRGLAPVRYTREGEPSPTRVMSPKDLVLIDEPTNACEAIDVQLGDLVVFSQLILHKSAPNHSDQVRWTIQIRHSDFGEARFAAAGFPFGDDTNLFHNDYLVEGKPR